MSDSQNMSDEVRVRLRAIPSVNELLAEWPVVKAAGETCDAVVHAAVTAELDEERAAIRAGAAPRSKRELASAIEWRAHRSALPSLRPAVNATGVVIHTNLGRAPLAESAAKAVAEVARGYSTLEYSVDTCSRGSRKEHAAQLIRSLTGAEDALVVNNNAAAVLLVLATHAAGKEVIVSRGELVEIGGSFRIPDVMEASGAKLVEVGATNRTHLVDYERAITPDTAMILKVHPSNYRIEGFHEEVSSRELAALAHKHGLLFYEDQGSGALLPDDILVRGGEETTPTSVASGLDLVSCSGDKLLGAAQAGIIMGRRDLVQACGSHPLMRALRPGKLALTALEATLRIYMDGADVAHRDIPVLGMLTRRRLIWSVVPASCAIVWLTGSIRPVARAPFRWRSSRNRRPPVVALCLPLSCPRCALPCVLLTSTCPSTRSSARLSRTSIRRSSREPRTIAFCLTSVRLWATAISRRRRRRSSRALRRRCANE